MPIILLAIGRLTQNEHTRLQGNICIITWKATRRRTLRILDQIRRETHRMLGLEHPSPLSISRLIGDGYFIICIYSLWNVFPPGFHAAGSVYCANCDPSQVIGDGFHAQGSADFHGVSNLETIGNGFHAREADFRVCSNLKTIGNGFQTDEGADFWGCRDLHTVGKGVSLTSGGNVNFAECHICWRA